MATSSFTNRVSLDNKQAKKLSSILSSKKTIKSSIDTKNHKEIELKAISDFLGVAKK